MAVPDLVLELVERFARNRELVCMPDATTSEGKGVTEQLRHGADELTRVHRRAMAAQTAQESDSLMREKAMWDRRIDRLVYHLYGLTHDEIALVEESVAPA